MDLRRSSDFRVELPTSKRSVENLTCMGMLDELPGFQFSRVRNPVGGLQGWLNKTEERLLRRVRPELLDGSRVRGRQIAMDYVLHALFNYSKIGRFVFAVPPRRYSEFQAWAASAQINQVLSVAPTTALAVDGLSRFNPDIWLNLHGDHDFCFRLREQLSSTVFPTVTLQHGISSQNLLYDRFFRSMLTPTYPVDSLVCTSRSCQQAIRNIFDGLTSSLNTVDQRQGMGFRGRLDLIPLCVDTDRFTPAPKLPERTRLRIDSDTLMLLYVGYISQVKAELAPLLLVMKRLVLKHPNRKLLLYVAGTGPEEYLNELGGMIRELGLSNKVRLLTRVSDESKLSLFRAADVFVAPCDSMQESFGLTPVEAMSCALPQVVADWSGYRDTVVHGETGFLVATAWGSTDDELKLTSDLLGWSYDHNHQGQAMIADLDEMFVYIEELVINETLRLKMGTASRARAVTEFSPRTLATRFDALWGELYANSQCISLIPSNATFNATSYRHFFGHFASSVITDERTVSCLKPRVISLERVLSLSVASQTGLEKLNQEVLTEIICTVEHSCSQGESLSIARLIHSVKTSQLRDSYVRRHILFLAKIGWLALSDL